MVKVLGQPVASKYCVPAGDKEALREKLGWPKDKFTVLAVGGEPPESMLARLQKAVTQFNKGSTSAYALSFSMGMVHCLPQEDKSLLELLADAETFRANVRRLRNRAVFEVPEVLATVLAQSPGARRPPLPQSLAA